MVADGMMGHRSRKRGEVRSGKTQGFPVANGNIIWNPDKMIEMIQNGSIYDGNDI